MLVRSAEFRSQTGGCSFRAAGFWHASATRKRTGAIVPLVAISMIAILAFLALAIDLGIMTLAQTQAQQAADLGALTAARSLSNASGAQALAATNAGNALSYNQIYGQTIASTPISSSGTTATAPQLTLNFGTYDYSQATQTFTANFSPPTSGQPLTAVTATVTCNPKAAFSSIFGLSSLGTLSATATAVHRPRDIALVMDQSASMRFGTCLGFDFYTNTRTTNNPDSLYPQWGAYSSGSANMQGPNSSQTSGAAQYSISPSNTTTPAPTGSPTYSQIYMNSFYQNAASTVGNPNPTLIRAFDSYTSSDGGNTWTAPTSTQLPQIPSGGAVVSYSSGTSTLTSPLVAGTTGVAYPATGDYPIYSSGTKGAYAKTVNDITGSTSRNPAWELDGYSGYSALDNPNLGATNPLTDRLTNPTTVNGIVYTGASYNVNQPSYYFQVTNGGSGYSSAPTVSISGGPYSTPPTATASVSGGKVVGITLSTQGTLSYNGSSGYSTTTAPTVTLSGGGSGATATANLFPFSGYSQGPGFYGKTFFMWPPDPRRPLYTSTSTYTPPAWWTSAGFTTVGDTLIIKQFLTDFGYTTNDFANSNTGVAGIFTNCWPWPNDGGASLSNYLTTKVYLPGSAASSTTMNAKLPAPNASVSPRLLQPGDAVYQLIMRLYNWNYVIDNYNPLGSGTSYPGTTPCDWRLRFFGTANNGTLFNGSSSLNVTNISSGALKVNYNEILRWVAGTQNPFPQQLRAGRIRYYSAIPTQITGSYPSYGGTDQQFWKEAIDYALGFYAYGTNGTTMDDTMGNGSGNAMGGYGADFSWGSATTGGGAQPNAYMSYSDSPSRPLLRYWIGPINLVDYTHNCNYYEAENNPGTNPSGTWFTKSPGDGYEAPMYVGKQAFNAAIITMKTNHPNDWVTTMTYGAPRQSGTGSGNWNSGSYAETNNQVRCPLGTNYDYASAALFFPLSSINGYGVGGPSSPSTAPGSSNYSEVTPFDTDPATGMVPSANFQDIVRGNGDTCFAMGLMLAYNQFITTPTTDTTLRTFVSNVANPPSGGNSKTPIDFLPGTAGGMGRKGAQKVVIFETDGVCNMTASVSGSGSTGLTNFSSSTGYAPKTYYPIRYDMNNPKSSEYPTTVGYTTTVPPSSGVSNQIYNLVVQMNNDFGSTRNPFKLYTLAFGPVFNTGAPDRSGALTVLYNMQYYASLAPGSATPGGSGGGPSLSPPAMPSSGPYPVIQSNQIITGTDSQMISNMTAAYTSILQSGVQIALIK